MTWHADLDVERWQEFGLDRQILMIGHEMNRAARWLDGEGLDSLQRGYERVLRLTDLTISCRPRRAMRRELLRWRDLVAELFVAEGPSAASHRAAFKALLRLTPESSKQIAHVLGE